MAFMQLQSEFGRWYLVETKNGTEVVPEDVCGSLGIIARPDEAATPDEDRWGGIMDALADYIEASRADVQSVECVEKWGARYSALGYMDATDWVLADTQEEAESECREMYGEDEEEETEE